LHVHWQHHFRPTEPRLVFTPWWALAGLVAATGLIGWRVDAVAAGAAALGMSLVLFFYETTHLAAHVPYRPRTRWGAFMKRFHLLHHFHNERFWFGVTHPLADWLARTWRDPAGTDRSSTARTLGISNPR
jgi:hypothetical protein